MLLDGGAIFRPLPLETVLERHQLIGYALPGTPEIRLTGDLVVELDLNFKPETLELKAFFFNFAANISQQFQANVSSRGHGLFTFSCDAAKARQMTEQALAHFRR